MHNAVRTLLCKQKCNIWGISDLCNTLSFSPAKINISQYKLHIIRQAIIGRAFNNSVSLLLSKTRHIQIWGSRDISHAIASVYICGRIFPSVCLSAVCSTVLLGVMRAEYYFLRVEQKLLLLLPRRVMTQGTTITEH